MNKERIAIITEGDVREIDIFENIKSLFFKTEKVDVIAFPAGENIYMLWKQLKEDDFQTDIIELVREHDEKASELLEGYSREDFSEVYLFFDFDGHQNNLSADDSTEDVLEEMLNAFDNETENGLLYVNYPMVEAVRDYVENDCKTFTACYLSFEEFGDYKKMSSENNVHNKFSKYQIEDWNYIIDSFTRRLSCLFRQEEVIAFDKYKDIITPSFVYKLQKTYILQRNIFVLCAFPEFLLDYYKKDFWHRMVKHGRNNRKICKVYDL